MTTRASRAAPKAAEQSATVPLMAQRFYALRDLQVQTADGRVVTCKRGEMLGPDFLNAPRVNVQKLVGVRYVRAEFVEL